MTKINSREEVWNVILAQLLEGLGNLALPEQIKKIGLEKRLPDVLIAQYFGNNISIEGKYDESKQAREQLAKQCKERIEEGIASIAIGVLYPKELRYVQPTKNGLKHAQIKIKIFSEKDMEKMLRYIDKGGDEEGWIISDIMGLNEIISLAYENVVNEDIVESSVEELKSSIDFATEKFVSLPGIARKLNELLVVPYTGEDDEKEE